MKKAYYIVTTVLSGLFTAFVLFLIINFIIFFDLDGTVLGTGVFALVGAGFLAVSVFGLIKKTFVLSAILAKIGILAIGAGTLVFTLMAYEHDLGPRPVSFSIISWLIGLAFIGAGIFVQPAEWLEVYVVGSFHALYGGISINLAAFAEHRK